MSLHIFGIRHHGPGCARSLLTALDELLPDVIVMEGPPDAEMVLPLAAHEQMKPPVALLIHPVETPEQAAFFPLTEFSPEWQTLRWAARHQVPIRMMDLPQAHQFPLRQPAEESGAPGQAEDQHAEEADASPDDEAPKSWRTDPLALLGQAAGYADHELWWEGEIERRQNANGLFAAILEAMRTVREEVPGTTEFDLTREAFMRKTLRAVVKENHQRIAVVCGAWHAPVLDEAALGGKLEGCQVTQDNERLKNLPKVKVAATWIPWTHSRLSYRSGYGAGVSSPGWYAHLWTSPEAAPIRWITTAARLLREKDLDASSASIIEAIRLADALAALRELRAPGLAELNEAIQTVLCHEEPSPMQLIRSRLEVGNVLGSVPEETPAVPLARDLAQAQKSLRLKPSTEIRLIDLDLRKETDLQRSHLLHRLNLLSIPWGQVETSGGRSSTFHEVWRLEWKPEFAVAVIEANVWGNTVESAATAKVIQNAQERQELPQITALLNASVLAGMPATIEPLVNRIQQVAAVGADLRQLMDALPPLARVCRYSDVRGTQAQLIEPIVVGMLERVTVGIGLACAALDDDAAQRMLTSMARVGEALDLLNRPELSEEWRQRLRELMVRPVHSLLRGWCCRLLLEKGLLTSEELEQLARLALSPGNPAADCAAWAAGLLRGSGLLLLHEDTLWQVLDHWLNQLTEDTFHELLPLLRRAFADFSGPERRQMGEKVRHLQRTTDGISAKSVADPVGDMLDWERSRRVVPVLAQILGVELK